MTPTDEIQTAIRKLETLRDEATAGPWLAWYARRGHSRVYGLETDSGDDLAMTTEGDARLIATLHRTIEAQLHLLNNAHETEIVGLARAINGGAS